jgi:hypothetical protein
MDLSNFDLFVKTSRIRRHSNNARDLIILTNQHISIQGDVLLDGIGSANTSSTHHILVFFSFLNMTESRLEKVPEEIQLRIFQYGI